MESESASTGTAGLGDAAQLIILAVSAIDLNFVFL